jgi:cell division septum initiation protein DivIVA
MTATIDENDKANVSHVYNDILYLAGRFGGLLTFTDKIKTLADVERLAAEAETRLDQARTNEARIRKNLTHQAIVETNAEIQVMTAEAKRDAIRIVQAAQDEAERITATAKSDAEGIITKARAEAGGIAAKLSHLHAALQAVKEA